jgi:hypothetical protein
MRRDFFRFALVLAFGLLLTLGSALALAAWMPFETYPRHERYDFIADGRPWNAGLRYHRGVWNLWRSQYTPDYVTAPPPLKEFIKNSLRALVGAATPPDPTLPTTPEGWMNYAREQRRMPSGMPIKDHDSPPAWGSFASGDPLPRHVTAGADFGFGWPRPALWYRVYGSYALNYAFASEIEGGILLTPPSTLEIRAYQHRALPLRPHWPGILANTAFFAATGSLVFFPSSFRGQRRRRRGHCPHCGYDLRHDLSSPCPECGRIAQAPGRGGA